MGRRPKTPELHDLSGNAGKRRRQVSPRKPATAFDPENAYAPPKGLSKGARVIWLEEIERIRATGYVKASDLSAYRIYCEAAARHRQCGAIIAKKGFTYATGTGFERPRPEISIMQREERTMLACLKELASTAPSRMKAAAQGELFRHTEQGAIAAPNETDNTMKAEVTAHEGRDHLRHFGIRSPTEGHA
ncbi:P27 family phage terminase small subunit [Asaia siamensis]